MLVGQTYMFGPLFQVAMGMIVGLLHKSPCSYPRHWLGLIRRKLEHDEIFSELEHVLFDTCVCTL